MHVSLRGRLVALVAVLVVAGGGAVTHVARARGDRASANANASTGAPSPDTHADLATVAAAPHLVFRNTARGPGYGRVALAPLSAPDGPRAITPAACDRVYATAERALCLSAAGGVMTRTYRVQLVGPDWSATRDLQTMPGFSSRARLSRDGAYAATTAFVHGDSYNNPGQFSTRTTIARLDGPPADAVDLEDFELLVNGRANRAVDRNIWGVTFAGGDRFYATAASGGRTWLVEGSLSARRLTALREDAECPSLSPDRTRIAFKKHGNLPPGQWRLAVYDLATGAETLLAESRSVDDQAEWLDDSRIVYGLPRRTAEADATDVWVVPADGNGSAQLLVRNAWSPAAVR